MIPATDKQKERYYQVVFGKATEVYTSWNKSGMTSKGLVAQATAYAFDKRLKTDAVYRFRALVFACALGMRVEKRYAKLLQKLFRILAFLRERNALATLKRVLGFQAGADVWDMVSVELKMLATLLSKRDDEGTKGGGKHSEMGDLLSEDALENFLTEVAQEDLQKMDAKDFTVDKAENIATQNEQSPIETEASREKISVEEFETEKDGTQKKQTSSKEEKTETLNKALQKETQDSGKQVNSTEKTLKNVAAFTGTVELAQEVAEETPSPFPIFRENETVVESQKESVVETKEETPTFANEKGEGTERNAGAETERDKDVFPVFNGNKGDLGDTPEKPIEKPMEKEVKSEVKNTQTVNNLSEENKARFALHDSLSEKEIELIVNHIKEMAKITMAQEEAAWREQFSVTQNSAGAQISEQVQVSQQSGEVIQNAKK